MEVQEGGGITLKTAHERYIVAEEDGTIKADRTVAKRWETFSPECLN